jgi:hypothetical protein
VRKAAQSIAVTGVIVVAASLAACSSTPKAISGCQLEPGTTCVGANLEDADLSGMDLSGSNFRDANFTGADLRDTNFSNADLDGALFVNANVSGADFAGAKDANVPGPTAQVTLYMNGFHKKAGYYGGTCDPYGRGSQLSVQSQYLALTPDGGTRVTATGTSNAWFVGTATAGPMKGQEVCQRQLNFQLPFGDSWDVPSAVLTYSMIDTELTDIPDPSTPSFVSQVGTTDEITVSK